MKNFLIIVLLFVHTAASSGTVLSLHYCMGDFASVSIGHKDKKGCDKCGMEKKGCCHDDVKVIKLDNNDITYATNNHSFYQPGLVVFHTIVDHNVGLPLRDFKPAIGIDAFAEDPPIFLLNCNFRI